VVDLFSETPVAEAGSTVSLTFAVHNQGPTVDQVLMEILGPGEVAVCVEPRTFNLFPGDQQLVQVSIALPDPPGIRDEAVPFMVGVRSTEHPEESVLRRGEIRIARSTRFDVVMVPVLLRSDASEAAALVVKNEGTGPLSLSFAAEDPENALVFEFTSQHLLVEPHSSGDVAVVVRPRSVTAASPGQTWPFAVTVTEDSGGASRRLDATFVHSPPSTARPESTPLRGGQRAQPAAPGSVRGRKRRWPLAFAILAVLLAILGMQDLLTSCGADWTWPSAVTPP
jgi:hypothetical protein